MDKSKSSTKKPLLGGSLFPSSPGSLPPELQPLAPLQVAVSKSSVSSNAAVSTANSEYNKLNDPAAETLTPPVHAARLSALLKSLANAESSVSEIIKSRQNLIAGLEKLLDTNRAALEKEKSDVEQMSNRKAETENKKRDVEDAIMRGLSVDDTSTPYNNGDTPWAGSEHFDPNNELEAPAVEALTPPPVEALTPVMSPKLNPTADSENNESGEQNNPLESQTGGASSSIPDIMASLAMAQTAQNSLNHNVTDSNKKRKVIHNTDAYPEFEGDAMADLDADVAELLRQESNK